MTPKKPTNFFDLPVELRQQIYGLLLPNDHVLGAINRWCTDIGYTERTLRDVRLSCPMVQSELDDWLSKTCGAKFEIHDDITLQDDICYTPPLDFPYNRLRYIEVWINHYNKHRSGSYTACRQMWDEGMHLCQQPCPSGRYRKIREIRRQIQDMADCLKRYDSVPLLYVHFRDEDRDHRFDHKTIWCKAEHCHAAKAIDMLNEEETGVTAPEPGSPADLIRQLPYHNTEKDLFLPQWLLEPLLDLPPCDMAIIPHQPLTNIEARTERPPTASTTTIRCHAPDYMHTFSTAFERWLEGTHRSTPFQSSWRTLGAHWQQEAQTRRGEKLVAFARTKA